MIFTRMPISHRFLFMFRSLSQAKVVAAATARLPEALLFSSCPNEPRRNHHDYHSLEESREGGLKARIVG